MSPRRSRRLSVAVAVSAAALTLGTAFGATSATASSPDAAPATSGGVTNPYSPAYGHPYRHGSVPTRELNTQMHRWEAQSKGSRATQPKTLSYGGGVDGIGVTSGTPKVYLVFWGSQWGTQGTDASGNLTFTGDPKTGAPVVQKLFKGLGTGGESWSGVMTQYCDGPLVAKGATSCPAGSAHVGYPTGGNLAGVWDDPSAAAPSSATPMTSRIRLRRSMPSSTSVSRLSLWMYTRMLALLVVVRRGHALGVVPTEVIDKEKSPSSRFRD